MALLFPPVPRLCLLLKTPSFLKDLSLFIYLCAYYVYMSVSVCTPKYLNLTTWKGDKCSDLISCYGLCKVPEEAILSLEYREPCAVSLQNNKYDKQRQTDEFSQKAFPAIAHTKFQECLGSKAKLLPLSKETTIRVKHGVSSAVEHSPGMGKVLSLIPSIVKRAEVMSRGGQGWHRALKKT